LFTRMCFQAFTKPGMIGKVAGPHPARHDKKSDRLSRRCGPQIEQPLKAILHCRMYVVDFRNVEPCPTVALRPLHLTFVDFPESARSFRLPGGGAHLCRPDRTGPVAPQARDCQRSGPRPRSTNVAKPTICTRKSP